MQLIRINFFIFLLMLIKPASSADFYVGYFHIAPNECSDKATVVSKIADDFGATLAWRGIAPGTEKNTKLSYELYNSNNAWVITEDRGGKSCIVDYGYYSDKKLSNNKLPECSPVSNDLGRALEELADVKIRWIGISSDENFSYSLYTGNAGGVNRNRWVMHGALQFLRSGCFSVIGSSYVQIDDF
jgi:hypothetical protein